MAPLFTNADLPNATPETLKSLTGLSEQISTCHWFRSVGTGILEDVERAGSWGEATTNMLESPQNASWSQMWLEAQNRISMRASEDDWKKFQEEWNTIAVAIGKKADCVLQASLKPVLVRLSLPSDIFRHYRGIVRMAFITIAYFNDPGFRSIHHEILDLAFAGYCPCGYRGEFPSGRLLVY